MSATVNTPDFEYDILGSGTSENEKSKVYFFNTQPAFHLTSEQKEREVERERKKLDLTIRYSLLLYHHHHLLMTEEKER